MNSIDSGYPQTDLCSKKKGHESWMTWLLIIMIILLIGSCILSAVFFMMAFSAGGSSSSSSSLGNIPETYVMGEQFSKNKILEIPISGTIMDNEDPNNIRKNMILRISTELKAAEKDKSVKAIVITMNSPGGGITATDIIWNDIKNFKKRTNIPIVVYCKDVAASGGYYIATTGDYIIATETSLVGSIGVIAQFTNLEQLLNKVGIKMNVITSKTWDGKKSYKDMGSFSREMTPQERAIFQDLIQQMWTRFTTVVSEGRKDQLTPEEVKKLADGRIYTGTDALKMKLIDANGYKEDAFIKAKELAKVGDAKMVTYKHRYSVFMDMFETKFQQKSLLPEPKEVLEQASPKLMYLWIAQ